MALTPAEIEVQILAIQTRIAKGVRSTQQPDIGSVTYNSFSEDIALLAYYQGLLGLTDSTGTSQSVGSYSKD